LTDLYKCIRFVTESLLVALETSDGGDTRWAGETAARDDS
jgi:hypothetical protein